MFKLWLKFQENMENQWALYSQIKNEMIEIVNKINDFYPKPGRILDAPINEATYNQMVQLFSYEYLKCFVHIQKFAATNDIYTKQLYSRLISTSHILEDFLDFHGAKNNRKWYYFRELTATVRHLSLAGYSQKHILNRLPCYLIDNKELFLQECNKSKSFITTTLTALSKAILNEAKELELQIPNKIEWEFFPRLSYGENLEADIDEELDDLEKFQQKKNYVKIASDFLNIVKAFERHDFDEPYSFLELKKKVPVKINEVEIRKFDMVVHNLQSYFDSYVTYGTGVVYDLKLKKLRGFFSIILHLLKMMGRLLHFYERHILDVGIKNINKRVRNRLATIVDTEQLLDRIINFGLYYICFFLNSGKELAKEILNENVEQGTITVNVPVKQGFHMRPSLLVAKIVEYYGADVSLCAGDSCFDASSVLDIQWAGGKIQKEKISQVKFKGDTRALNDIKILADVNYGEDSIGRGVPLPGALSYLR